MSKLSWYYDNAKNIDAGDFRVDLNDRFLILQETIFLTIEP